jgi:hypothetical protein
MDTDGQIKSEDKPLTREDVERLPHEVGSPNKLNLSRRILEKVELDNLDLSRAYLRQA